MQSEQPDLRCVPNVSSVYVHLLKYLALDEDHSGQKMSNVSCQGELSEVC